MKDAMAAGAAGGAAGAEEEQEIGKKSTTINVNTIDVEFALKSAEAPQPLPSVPLVTPPAMKWRFNNGYSKGLFDSSHTQAHDRPLSPVDHLSVSE